MDDASGNLRVDLLDGVVIPAPGPHDPLPNDRPAQITTLRDLALRDITLAQLPVVQRWRARLFQEHPEVCDELPRLLTAATRQGGSRAQVVAAVFRGKSALVGADDLLPGRTTTSFVGPVVYADTIGACIWPELDTLAERGQNPFTIRPEVAERLNREIFPYWLERRTLAERARYSVYDSADFAAQAAARDRVAGAAQDPPLRKAAGETPKCQELMERLAFYLSDKTSAVSHTVPDFERLLRHGLDGLLAQMERDRGRMADGEPRRFLAGVMQTFEGAREYAARLAEAAGRVGNGELAALCRRVPAQPARTLHEALTALWIAYHLLLQENTNFGFSIGRLDQLLQPYYLADWQRLPGDEGARAAYRRRAVELVCHFFLHCSDHVPLSTRESEVLFAGSGSNQALTLGGVRLENGVLTDAVNDMTYIVLKATELLAIRDPNVHARYHREVHHRDANGAPLPAGSVDAYLTRICQVNLATRATPALHGDQPVIAAMAAYYAAHAGVGAAEALADACDYAAIGCIEQNAAGKHYGHTGSSLVVLPAVLELALYGGKHRSDGVGPDDPTLLGEGAAHTTPPLGQMADMAEFEAAFRVQLEAMAGQVVRNNNYLGRSWERYRPSPFLSGLYHGPTNLPGASGASFRDVAAGGAKYNSAGVAIIGLADVIDSFCVLEALVFGGRVGADELLQAMADDFQPEGGALPPGRMREIVRLIRRVPKYGAGVAREGPNDNSLALKHTTGLVKMIHEVFYGFRTHRGGRYLAGYWSMTNHAGFGMLTKATPNGRRAGQPFAGGITPCPGIVKPDGGAVTILDQMLSVAAVEANLVHNGYTYNLSLTPGGVAAYGQDCTRFAHYLRTFMEENGVLAQMCVTSLEQLRAADAAANAAERAGAGTAEREALRPFQDLMIRVAGYSAYYVTLSPAMRREIIERANFALADGHECHAPAP